MANNPQLLGYSSLLGDTAPPVPSKWDRIKQALWESNLNSPVRGFYNLMNTPYDVLMGGDSPEKQQAVADSFDAAGGITVGSMPMPKPANSLSMGIKAYHGSPHSFDKFSMDKIGTGEGAQAYGHGLYFAENEDIARSYRDALATGVKPELRPTDKYSTVGWKAEAEKLFPNDRERQAAFHLFNQMKNKDYVLENHDFITSLPHNQGKPYEWEGVEFTRDRLAQLADEFYDPGHMYEVNIAADPNTFLDWDKPLSEQPEAVRNAIPKLIDSAPQPKKGPSIRNRQALNENDGSVPGDIIWNNLGGHNFPEETRKRFLEAGIPGIKYLDAGSRVPSAMAKKELADWQAQMSVAERELADATARGDKWLISRKQAELKRVQDGMARVSKEAEGTRNYVVFDDKLISIVRKYGIAGASAMLGYNLLEGVDKAQAAELQKADTHHQYTNWLSSGGI